jgi:pimeloyl-ACP methyl ester carboxylesterase
MTRAVADDGIRFADVGAVRIAFETFGDPGDPAVVLVMGLATQMLGWPEGFCSALVERELFVLRFDNRDIGLSTHLHGAPRPNVMAGFRGDCSSASYTLSDMADDTVGLLDALGLDQAHFVGASMGGMIAQTVAIEHPERVLTLTSIMSSTGDQRVGGSTEAAARVLARPPARNRAEAIQRTVDAYRVIGSPGFELDEAGLRERAGRSFDRGYDPLGVGRQMMAILASPDRTRMLRALRIPTLVVHGAADPLVHVSGGRATAAAIPGAELLVIDGMGHDLPRDLWPLLANHIAALISRDTRSGQRR